jgi:sRNA-binding protein
MLALASARWPLAFSVHQMRRRPLKIGIHLDILAELGDAVPPAELALALRCYVANRVYRSRLVAGAVRIGLDGEPAGVVTAREAEYAARVSQWRQKAKAVTHGGDRKSDQKYSLFLKTQKEVAEPVAKAAPAKRISLADLKRAAQQRRMAVTS